VRAWPAYGCHAKGSRPSALLTRCKDLLSGAPVPGVSLDPCVSTWRLVGPPPQVHGVEWNPHQNDDDIPPAFVTFGRKHIKLWTCEDPRGLGGWKAKQMSFGKLPMQVGGWVEEVKPGTDYSYGEQALPMEVVRGEGRAGPIEAACSLMQRAALLLQVHASGTLPGAGHRGALRALPCMRSRRWCCASEAEHVPLCGECILCVLARASFVQVTFHMIILCGHAYMPLLCKRI